MNKFSDEAAAISNQTARVLTNKSIMRRNRMFKNNIKNFRQL